eukprot:TRINITY_DN7546_c0_g1_i1.p1 TRINITY_DN7546_c0_g1~~TRINITY_DN7546_c0_g1_i1.p1  ORF type:complete len:317 (-),score=57.20 TRINITY_DN7546_c0_g1_i1:141-1091(-)
MDETLERQLEARVMNILSTPRDGRSFTEGPASQLQSELETVVECPVCYNIPRDLPIPCCPAGHIMCTTCRGRVLHCPTCRRQLEDNTSSLAAALIEKVQHKCLHWDFGCREKNYLGSIVRHEEMCKDRTVQCPGPNGCEEKVQLKEFHRHAVRNSCTVELKERTKFNLSKGWMQWDGMTLKKGQEFNLREDLAWSFFHFSKFEQQFYFSAQYFAAEELFLFYVMVLGGTDATEDFKSSVSIVNAANNSKITFEGPIMAIDKIPRSEENLMVSPACFSVHYRTMRNMLSITEVGENRNLAWSVDFETEVNVTQIMQM